MFIPRLEIFLPELAQFTRQLAAENVSGSLSTWRAFIERVHAFYTPSVMDKIEQTASGWRKMASFADQQTLIHVTSVLAALYLLPEYQRAAPDDQALMEWMVLFHDITKEAKSGTHDYIHAFRSAAVAGRALSKVGFPTSDDYADRIDAWVSLTHNAVLLDAAHGEYIQDNRKLPQIISGIDDLYGVNAPAGQVIKGVLLHLSIATDPDYPTVAPLSDIEIQQYVDVSVYPLLKAMMLVDNDGWNFFDSDKKHFYRQQTLAVFDHIAALIEGGQQL